MDAKVNQITKQDFEAYYKVQMSGQTNMFDVAMVEQLSGLSREKILNIMSHYGQYKDQWISDNKTQ